MKRWLYLVILLMIGNFTGHARQVVDVHSHNILPDYRQVLARHHAELEEGFPLPAWDVDSHLSFMDSAGIACTVLSMPAPQPSFGDSEECRQVIRACNEYGAQLKAAHPDRFRFCAALPLPDVESAVAEAIYALDTLGADGELSAYADLFLHENAARLFALPSVGEAGAALAERSSVVEAEVDTAMLVRISEIEIYPQYRDAYLEAALEVGATSVREEPGVIAIFPMIQQRDSCQVRILEIYSSPEAYRHHIGTAHFQTYKQGTLHMVKTLDLVDMIPMNPAAMPEIFRKMQRVK
ncbi:antibiotic biosynthesis monooxygenase [Barnesiella sp. An22]|uniref:antibiotic biosynthesis monooxygenase n=1 Tax=Barnesiella sp. An22 TaxID=1965590 RepID=UPI00320A473B